jgi:hypothetical protein
MRNRAVLSGSVTYHPDNATVPVPHPPSVRHVRVHVLLPQRLPLEPGNGMAAPQTPPQTPLQTPPQTPGRTPSLLLWRQMVAIRPRMGDVQPGQDALRATSIGKSRASPHPAHRMSWSLPGVGLILWSSGLFHRCRKVSE